MGHLDSVGRDTGIDPETVIDASGLTYGEVVGTGPQLAGFEADVFDASDGHKVGTVTIVRKWTGTDDVVRHVAADGTVYRPRPYAGLGLIIDPNPPKEPA